ncbi:hypothetical protein [Mycobacterium sp. Marseille-P9652]|uniref:hypothetical protein n=1 Tax=Mycobacterium sp. Marseille-P9652 TaxID=2654950 RepID=UPI0012E926EA|nr:hypothetical protein [Mycobacterium sp. Marseille-P9652]
MNAENRTRRWSTGLLAGGLALTALGLAGGTAEAAPPPPPSGHWCPGEPWNPGWGKVTDWDWNQCHDWPGPGAPFGPGGWGPWGPPPIWAPPQPPPPPWAPGANLMWNPVANTWGLYNHGVWTPI